MKKQLFALGLTAATALSLNAQVVTGTVSVGASYANHKFYSLENGEVGTQPKDNWDIAFEITGYSSAILANTQKANFAVYKTPYEIADYATVDTAGISSWPILYNSDTTWNVGAFNRGANPANSSDLGWGVYDMNTHYVNGDSCYVVKLSTTVFKKLKIVSLISGVYTFEYANIDGSATQSVTIAKSTYTGKNFVYFDMTGNTAVDREPVSSSWDLQFGRYTAFVPTPYPVVGIMANKGVLVAQMNDVANPSTFSNWVGAYLSGHITTIGHDWKTVDINTSQWKVVDDTVYLVRDKLYNIWKMRMIAFGGSSNGNYVFSKEKLSATGIADAKGNTFTEVLVYPNPALSHATLMFSSQDQSGDVMVSVSDLTGKVLSTEKINVASGLNQYQLNTAGLSSGVYFISLQAGSYITTQKLIKH